MRYLIVLSFLLLIFSCTGESSQDKEGIIFPVDIECPVVFPLTDFFEVIDYVELETVESGLVSYISRIIINEKRIYIFSEKKGVQVFSDTGKYLYNIGKSGKGPNELINPTDFDLSPNGDQVAIWDRDGAKLVIHDLDGNVIQSIKSKQVKWGFRFCWLATDRFLLSSLYLPQKSVSGEHQVYLLDQSLKIVNGEIPYEKKLEGLGEMGKVFQKYSDGSVQFRHPTEGDVFIMNPNAKRLYGFDFGTNQLKNERRVEYIKNPKLAYEDYLKSNYAKMINFIDLDRYFYGGYVFQGKYYSVLINKDNGTQRRYRHSLSLDFLSDIQVIGYCNEKLLAYVEPYKLKEKLMKVTAQDRIKYEKEIKFWKKIVKDKPDTDNPIIVFLKPREF